MNRKAWIPAQDHLRPGCDGSHMENNALSYRRRRMNVAPDATV